MLPAQLTPQFSSLPHIIIPSLKQISAISGFSIFAIVTTELEDEFRCLCRIYMYVGWFFNYFLSHNYQTVLLLHLPHSDIINLKQFCKHTKLYANDVKIYKKASNSLRKIFTLHFSIYLRSQQFVASKYFVYHPQVTFRSISNIMRKFTFI